MEQITSLFWVTIRMSYAHFEIQGVEITDEQKFRREVCGTCKHQQICEEWEFATGKTLYANKQEPGELFAGDSGKKGVYRCALYAP